MKEGVQPRTLDGLQEVSGRLQTSVGAVASLRCESHGSTIGSTSTSLLVIGTTCVPGQSEQDGTIAPIIILILVRELSSDLFVDLLVVLELWGKETSGLGRRSREERTVAGAVEVVAAGTTSEDESSKTNVDSAGGGLSGRGRVCATRLLAEALSGGCECTVATGTLEGRSGRC